MSEFVVGNINDNFKFEFKSWHFHKVKRPDCEENYIFYNLLPPLHYTEIISPKLIVGSTHSDYYEKTWLEMLLTLKRSRHYYGLEKLKVFIQDESIGEKKSLTKINERYYIDGGGNHRVCYAKFLEYEQIACSIMERVFDEEVFSLFNRICSFGLVPKIANEITPCRDHWLVSIGQDTLQFNSIQSVKNFINDFEATKLTCLGKLEYHYFRRNNEHYLCYSRNKEVRHMVMRMKILALAKQNVEENIKD